MLIVLHFQTRERVGGCALRDEFQGKIDLNHDQAEAIRTSSYIIYGDDNV